MAFRLINPNIKINVPLYPKVERELATVKKKSKTVVGGFELRHKIDYIPQPGLQEDVCSSECNLVFMCGQGTAGKAQPYDAKVLTPNGFVDMGSLKAGDVICGVDGKSQTVLKIFEQGEKNIFRLVFDDGAQTECCDEHLWEVHRKRAKNSFSPARIMQLKDIRPDFKRGTKFAIRLCKPIHFAEDSLPIDPYLLGLMIGDGHMRKNMSIFSSADTECIDAFRNAGYRVSKRYGENYDYNISGQGFNQALKELGLTGTHSNNKFIPNAYKYNSVNNRIALLQGLIDTDGYVDKKGEVEFYTISHQLAKDVQWIVRSFGGRCSISLKHPKYEYNGVEKQGQTCYVLHLYTPENTKLARLPRKKERLFDGFRHGTAELRRRIVKIEPCGRKRCRCILVSNEDHLYITDDFVVTHNTFALYFKALGGCDKKDFTARIISYQAKDNQKGSAMLRDGIKTCGEFAGCEKNTSHYPLFMWPQWNSNLQLIHCNFNGDNPEERDEFEEYAKKQQASLIMIDEATAVQQFDVFTFWFMRNRDDSGMIPQMILTFNPKHKHWTTQMLRDAGYLGEDWYLRKDMIGKVRYFYVNGDNPEGIVWGETKAEVVERAGLVLKPDDAKAGMTVYDYVKSFSVYTGTASGNRELVNATGGQSVANLHAVGKTQRAVVGDAYFGPIENEEINVNRQMIHNLWLNPTNNDNNMYASMDISKGGMDSDGCPCIIWKGLQIIAIEFFRRNTESEETHQLENFINGILQRYNIPITNLAYDAGGIGGLVEDFLKKGARGINGQGRVEQEYDKDGNQVTVARYFNLRSQLHGKTEIMLKKGEISISLSKDAEIPYGKKNQRVRLLDVLFKEIDVFTTIDRNGKIYYRNKEEYKAKHQKSSPDIMDAITYRAIFELDTRERKQPQKTVPDNVYHNLYHRPKIVGGWGRYR